MKKIFSLILVTIMSLSLCAGALAAEGDDPVVTAYYPLWDWDNGPYIASANSKSGIWFGSSFEFPRSYMYINANFTGATDPVMDLNIQDANGNLTFVGEYKVTYSGEEGVYDWNNYRRPVTAGNEYQVSFVNASSVWKTAYFVLNNQSLN